MQEYLINNNPYVLLGTKDAFICKIITVEYSIIKGICHSPTTKEEIIPKFRTAFYEYGLKNFENATITLYRGNGEVNKFDKVNIAEMFGVDTKKVITPPLEVKCAKTAVIIGTDKHLVLREEFNGIEAGRLFEKAKQKGKK